MHEPSLLDGAVFTPSWVSRSADCLTIMAVCTQLLERPQPLPETQQQRMQRMRAAAEKRLHALERALHELSFQD
jgi:hypothetical protein